MQAAPQVLPQGRNISELIEQVTAALAAAGVGTPHLDAELLLAAASGTGRTALYARGLDRAASPWLATLQAMVARRLAREPLQYIIGTQEFWSLDFTVTPDVLIPRPETELLVELTLRTLATRNADEEPPSPSGACSREDRHSVGEEGGMALCDMGTGSGCIAVALARELPQADIWAVDASPAALSVAEVNARCHGVAHRIHWVASDLFESLGGRRFDVIVSNPPYVSAAELAALQPEVRWEPRRALDGGAAGLDVIARLLAAAPAHLVDGGSVIMEIGAGQEAAVRTLAAAHFSEVSVRRDYAGHPRVLLGRR
jgi:release factor glutamine methyltransferase